MKTVKDLKQGSEDPTHFYHPSTKKIYGMDSKHILERVLRDKANGRLYVAGSAAKVKNNGY